MSKIEELKHEIEELPQKEFSSLRKWIAEKDWQMWDKEIALDSQSGNLDFLINEAKAEKKNGNLKDL
jgi:hypothetical protein